MEITIINGHPGPGLGPEPESEPFDAALASLTGRWQSRSHTVTTWVLRDLDIRPCIGCWSCWWKTPGLCAVSDDTHAMRRSIRHADLMLLASPLILGFPSALLKNAIDRMIPLFHPYFHLEQGEFVHQLRYDHYPVLATLVEPGPRDAPEDLELVQRYFERFAVHFRSPVVAQLTPQDSQDSFEALVRATDRLAGQAS